MNHANSASVSARDALKGVPFKPDFDAYLSTPKVRSRLETAGPKQVRVLSVRREVFRRACVGGQSGHKVRKALRSWTKIQLHSKRLLRSRRLVGRVAFQSFNQKSYGLG